MVIFVDLLTHHVDQAFVDPCILIINYQNYDNYCMSVEIGVEHSIAHVHTQNSLAESFIKRLQLIARPLFMRAKLSTSLWGHAILGDVTLVRIRLATYHKYSPITISNDYDLNISHLRFFCVHYMF